MPENIVSSDQIDDWLSTLGGEGIEVVDSANQVKVSDKGVDGQPEAEEEETETGRPPKRKRRSEEEEEDGYSKTNDPVRMYLRKMGSVSLLTREGEVEIAKRIEDGERRVLQVVLNCASPSRRSSSSARSCGSRRSASRTSSRTSTRTTPSSTSSGTSSASARSSTRSAACTRRRRRSTRRSPPRRLSEAAKKRAKNELADLKNADVRGAAGAAPQQEADRPHRRPAQVLRHPHRGGRTARSNDCEAPLGHEPARVPQDAAGDPRVGRPPARGREEARHPGRGAGRAGQGGGQRPEEDQDRRGRGRTVRERPARHRARDPRRRAQRPRRPRPSWSRPTCASWCRSPRSTRTAACSSWT